MTDRGLHARGHVASGASESLPRRLMQRLGPRGVIKAEVICRRLLEPIGNRPPAESAARYHEQISELSMAA